MSGISNKELKNYYTQISRSAALCERKQKKAFLQDLKMNVEEYISEIPEATMEDVKGFFGSPERLAKSLMENTDGAKIKRKLQIKRVIVVSVVVALIIYALFVVLSLIDVHTEAHGYFEEGFLTVSYMIKDGELL